MATSVLFVCTGNVCRSPIAEYLLRSRAQAPVEVASAGLFALVGQPMDGPSASALAELGVDGSAHRGQQFDAAAAARVDLVLTAERAHRDEILTESPALFRKVFTMREFARLAKPVRGTEPAAAIATAAANRGQVAAVGAEDDIPDPFRGTIARARATAAQELFVVNQVCAVLGLEVAPIPRRPRPRPG